MPATGGSKTIKMRPKAEESQTRNEKREDDSIFPKHSAKAIASPAQTDFPRTLAGFERFCAGLLLDTGQPMVLEWFQKLILRAYFRGVREVVAILPAGNAKSTLLAALGLFHMLTTPRAECIVAAAAADQAGIIFDQMAGLVDGSELPLDVKRGIRAIYHKGNGPNRKPLGRIRVISADENRNSGAIPTLVLIDELQAHKDGRLYNMFQQRLNKRDAQMVTISNAGWDETSFLADIRQRAHEHPSFTRQGKLNHAELGPLEFFEWCLGDGDDPKNVRVVKKANPLNHVTEDALAERLASPALIWPEWLRNTCGIWTTAETPWLKAEDWDGLKVDLGGMQDGDEVYVSVRVATGVGIGIVAVKDRAAVKLVTIPAPSEGRAPLWQVENAIREIAERHEVLDISYDPDQFLRSAELLEEEGLPMSEVPQRARRLAQATSTMWRYISGNMLVHDGDPELRSQVLRAKTKDTLAGWHFDPQPGIAGLIAVAMALHQATEEPAPEPLIVLPSGAA